jgi:hypothetical protein
MKTYKDIYKFPLQKSKFISWVYDKKSNFVFQFEPKFINGDYAEGWKEFEQKVIDCLNSKTPLKTINKSNFIHKNGEIFAVQGENKAHIITIRGWGNLTGIGGHNLPSEDAANIQDTFAEFIINTLNL